MGRDGIVDRTEGYGLPDHLAIGKMGGSRMEKESNVDEEEVERMEGDEAKES